MAQLFAGSSVDWLRTLSLMVDNSVHACIHICDMLLDIQSEHSMSFICLRIDRVAILVQKRRNKWPIQSKLDVRWIDNGWFHTLPI